MVTNLIPSCVEETYARQLALVKEVLGLQAEWETAKDRIVDDWAASQEARLQIDEAAAEMASATNDVFRTSVALLAELEGTDLSGTVDHIAAAPAYVAFDALRPTPAALRRSNLGKYRHFVASHHGRCAPAAALAQVETNVRDRWRRAELPGTVRGRAAARAYEEGVADACAVYRPWLTRSDHEPIRVTLAYGEGEVRSVLRVASHNVQERAVNGILPAATSVPGMKRRKKGAGRLLADLVLGEDARAAYRDRVVALVRRELLEERTADVVCLQELSVDVVAHLRARLCAPRGPWMHASEGRARPARDGVECDALTGIVSVLPFAPLPDVVVSTVQATRVNVRRSAAVRLLAGPPLLLASVHVRHGRGSAGVNDACIGDLVAALAAHHAAHAGAPSSAPVLMAVGDFNGPIGRWDGRVHVLEGQGAGEVSVAAVSPPGPTAFAAHNDAYAIDGAVLLRQRASGGSGLARQGDPWEMDCVVTAQAEP